MKTVGSCWFNEAEYVLGILANSQIKTSLALKSWALLFIPAILYIPHKIALETHQSLFDATSANYNFLNENTSWGF